MRRKAKAGGAQDGRTRLELTRISDLAISVALVVLEQAAPQAAACRMIIILSASVVLHHGWHVQNTPKRLQQG